jgi:hypothetical protein
MFFILIVFVSIIFHLKSSLNKNYLTPPLLYMIFNFSLKLWVTLSTATCRVIR